MNKRQACLDSAEAHLQRQWGCTVNAKTRADFVEVEARLLDHWRGLVHKSRTASTSERLFFAYWRQKYLESIRFIRAMLTVLQAET